MVGKSCPWLIPIEAFGGVETKREEDGAGRWCWVLLHLHPIPPPPSTGLTWDFPPAPSTARVTERAQQMTWILKKEPKKLLQPRAIISYKEGAELVGGQRPKIVSVYSGSWAYDLRVTLVP